MAEASLIERRPIYKGRIVDLSLDRIRLPNGNVCELELIRHPGAAAVVPVDDEGRVLLVRQYRHASGGWLLEVPAGKLDGGEPAEECAARELEEETGYRASELIEIGRVDPNPAFLSNRCWTYLALGCRSDGTVSLDPSEEIEVSLVPIGDFARLIDDGTITHSLVIAAHDHLQRGLKRGADWAKRL